MPFLCPQCSQPSLEIRASLELPPDEWWDEITLQLIACPSCQFRGAAVYQESRRGALDSEAVSHHGYLLSGEDFLELETAIKTCPQPRRSSCDCSAHSAGLPEALLQDEDRFPMTWR